MKTFTHARFLNRLEKTTKPLLEGKGENNFIAFSFTEKSSVDGTITNNILGIECREMPDGTICCAPVQPDGSWKCRK